MAMNGRQKATMGALLSDADKFGRVPIEPITLLKYVVEQVDSGAMVLRDFNMEVFREPQFRDVMTVDGRYERMLLQANQFASVKFDIVPSGRVRDGDEQRDSRVSGLTSEDINEAMESGMRAAPTFDEPRKPLYKKPAAPTGASAAREVIFDDDGSDPT